MGQRIQHPKELINIAAYAVLLHSEWVSAVEAAAALDGKLRESFGIAWPWSYRPVAFALRRLVKAGLAQERFTTYRGKHRTKEERREYRLLRAHPCGVFFPTVQPIPPGVARRVCGRDMRDDQ